MYRNPRACLVQRLCQDRDGEESCPTIQSQRCCRVKAQMMFNIREARGGEDLSRVAELFSEYAAALAIDLSFQHFAMELASLPGLYAPPSGELFLASGDDGRALGCVAVRPLAQHVRCEMKRLYVRPEAQGAGMGRALAARAVHLAETRGYREIVLDTLPSMSAAIATYRRLGFVPVPPYYDNPLPGVLFFRKQLGIGPGAEPGR